MYYPVKVLMLSLVFLEQKIELRKECFFHIVVNHKVVVISFLLLKELPLFVIFGIPISKTANGRDLDFAKRRTNLSAIEGSAIIPIGR